MLMNIIAFIIASGLALAYLLTTQEDDWPNA